jgi:hypothetical protein
MNQIHKINDAIQAEWFNDTGGVFDHEAFWGRVFIYMASGADAKTAALIVIHSVGDKAVREFDMDSSLEQCQRNARRYQDVCRQILK